jgi:multidrug efflux pump subunit AcrA (membrane-fusion protein)
MQVTVDEEGETRVRDRFVVSSPVAGRVQRIELEPGDRVPEGAVVALVVPAPLDARAQAEAEAAARAASSAVGRVRAERQRADAALRLARSELQRLRALAEQRIVSEQALSAGQPCAAEDALQAAEFAVATATYQVQQARARLLSGSRRRRPVEVRAPGGRGGAEAPARASRWCRGSAAGLGDPRTWRSSPTCSPRTRWCARGSSPGSSSGAGRRRCAAACGGWSRPAS